MLVFQIKVGWDVMSGLATVPLAHPWAGLNPQLKIKGSRHTLYDILLVSVSFLLGQRILTCGLRHMPSQDSTLVTRDGMKPQHVINTSMKRLNRTSAAEG